ncbi:MAG: Trypsin [Gammaproteobacteria bacterium]|jgi:S1-C subfamily serine protease|nr:Trypsin [Gammaproteobacteria bacterium]
MSNFTEFQKVNVAPLTLEEQVDITFGAMNFFDLSNNIKYREELGLTNKGIVPFSVMEFFNWYKKDKLINRFHRVLELLRLLSAKGCLQEAETYVVNSIFDQRYTCMLGISAIERQGALFLGKYLGPRLVADQIKYNLAQITGKNENGDNRIGSGILINAQIVLTCAHVIEDMNRDDSLKINGIDYKIRQHEVHPDVDFGVIILEEPVMSPYCKDIALRTSHLLEEIIIAGFPTIPLSKDPIVLVQKGEISTRIESYLDKRELELFTAIARPGNSGGPVMSIDGKLLGIVTQSLERQQEENDLGQTILPYFASVPANVIFEAFDDLEVAKEFSIPWEDYQQ